MKMILEFKETPRGDVEFSLHSAESQGSTRKEQCYVMNVRDLLMREIPKLALLLGAKGVISSDGKPSNG